MKVAKTLAELKEFRQRNPLARIAIAGGIFDLLHVGHLKYLNFCKNQGELLVVHVGTDESVKKFKNKVPVISDSHRVEILKNLRIVDLVYSDDKTHRNAQLVKALMPDIIVLSKESCTTKEIQELKTANSNLQIVCNPRLNDGISTTSIIEKIRKQ